MKNINFFQKLFICLYFIHVQNIAVSDMVNVETKLGMMPVQQPKTMSIVMQRYAIGQQE